MASGHAHGGRSRKSQSVATSAKLGGCQLTELFQVLGKAHTLDILHIFHTDPRPHRFVDIQERLRLSPNTLSERLRGLVDAGLLARTAYNEIPPRVDYQATEKALALAPVFQSLQDWASRNNLKRASAAEPIPA